MSCRLISFLEQHWYELIRSTIKRSWTNQIFSSAGMLDELSRIWWVHGPCNTSQLSTMTQIFKPLLYKVTSIARTFKRTKQYKLLYKSKWHPTMGDNFSKLPLSKRGTGRERILIVCFFFKLDDQFERGDRYFWTQPATVRQNLIHPTCSSNEMGQLLDSKIQPPVLGKTIELRFSQR